MTHLGNRNEVPARRGVKSMEHMNQEQTYPSHSILDVHWTVPNTSISPSFLRSQEMNQHALIRELNHLRLKVAKLEAECSSLRMKHPGNDLEISLLEAIDALVVYDTELRYIYINGNRRVFFRQVSSRNNRKNQPGNLGIGSRGHMSLMSARLLIPGKKSSFFMRYFCPMRSDCSIPSTRRLSTNPAMPVE